jgi:hypothetical protein
MEYENTDLRRTFGTEMKLTEGWEKLHNEGFHNL